MAITEQGEAKWKAFKYARVVLKMFQMVVAPACIALVTMFKSYSYIHVKHPSTWFNITLKFPFHYEAGKTIFITNLSTPEAMSFTPSVSSMSWSFVGVQGLATLVSVLMLLRYICTHGNTNMDAVARVDAILSVFMAISLAVISSLWIYKIVALEQNVHNDITIVYTEKYQEDCVQNGSCEKHITEFLQLYAAAGLGLLSVMLWILSVVEAARYGLTSVLFFRQDVTGILEMNPDIGDWSVQT